LIDTNVWLALTWDLHPQHAAAARWFHSIEDGRLLFCRFTMLGFLRLLTNRQVMGDSTSSVADALDLYDRWRKDPRVEMSAEPHGAEERFRDALTARAAEPATKAIADCYLAGFADAAGARLVTFDRALARMIRSPHAPPVLLKASHPQGKK
jgi:toxin-antitoxin system PIN domain toxin